MHQQTLPFTSAPIKEIDLLDIKADTKVMMMRVKLDRKTVNEYQKAMDDGAVFPPILVFDINGEFILADGFHRYHAYKNIGAETVRAVVTKGTMDDAVLAAVKADAHEGLRRTNDDKRKAVMALLASKYWRGMSDAEIARHAGVHWQMVGKLRKEHFNEHDETASSANKPQLRLGKDGRYRDPQKRKQTIERRKASGGIIGRPIELDPTPPPPLPKLTREQIGAPSEELQDQQDPNAPPGTTYAMSFAAKYGHVHIRPLDVRLRQEREKKATSFVAALQDLLKPAAELLKTDIAPDDLIAALRGMDGKAMFNKFEERMTALEPLLLRLNAITMRRKGIL